MRALFRHPWLVVGLLALIAFGLTVNLLRAYVQPATVVVARVDLPAGTKLTADVLELKEVPKSAVPEGAFTRIEDAVGLTLTTARARGDVITAYVAGEAAASGIPSQLRAGHVAMAVRVDRATGIAGMLRPGQTVTVIALVDLSQIQLPQAAFVAQAPAVPVAPPPVLATPMGTPTPTPTPLPTPTPRPPLGPVARIAITGLRVLAVPQDFRYEEMPSASQEEAALFGTMGGNVAGKSVVLLEVPIQPVQLPNGKQVSPAALLALLDKYGIVYLALEPAEGVQVRVEGIPPADMAELYQALSGKKLVP